MKLLAFVVVSLLSAVLAVPSAPLSADIFSWSLSAAQPVRLAQITYDPSTLKSTLVSYSPPSGPGADSDSDLLRIGLYTSDKQWAGSLSSVAQLSSVDAPTVTLHLGPDDQPYHVSLSPSTYSKQQREQPNVEVVRSDRAAAPSPHLNKPVVVAPGGTGREELEEKSLFQR